MLNKTPNNAGDYIRYALAEVFPISILNSADFKDTPERIVRFWKEFVNYEDDNIGTVFAGNGTVNGDLACVFDVPFISICAHHLLPFWGRVHFGYVIQTEIIGLSKIPRIVKLVTRRPQVQEAIPGQIIEQFSEVVDNQGCIVVAEGFHSCMMLRGIESPGKMVTARITGDFEKYPELKQEFYSLLEISNGGTTFNR